MRLTVDLINQSLSYLNPLLERELDLRGNKIPAIENLGGAAEHDAIDLTDNEISILAGFPLMPRLKTILLARNRLAAISPGLERSVPNVHTLVLEQNRMSELADLDPLMNFRHLEHLVLIGNPVCRKEVRLEIPSVVAITNPDGKNYRFWVLWRAPSVRFLDYSKVRDSEREKAAELFGSREEPTPLAHQIANLKSREAEHPDAFTAVNGAPDGIDRTGQTKLTAQQRKQLEEMIRNTKSLTEMTRLEAALKEGRMPSGLISKG
ncbi:MAG: hypothetical protein Q9159_001220 [Coniocarpon cinnabarinum]